MVADHQIPFVGAYFGAIMPLYVGWVRPRVLIIRRLARVTNNDVVHALFELGSRRTLGKLAEAPTTRTVKTLRWRSVRRCTLERP